MPRWFKFVATFLLGALLSAPAVASLASCVNMQMEASPAESCAAHSMHVPTPKVQGATKSCCSLQAPSVPTKRAELRAVDNVAAALQVTVAATPQVDPESVVPAAAPQASRSAPQGFFVLLI